MPRASMPNGIYTVPACLHNMVHSELVMAMMIKRVMIPARTIKA